MPVSTEEREAIRLALAEGQITVPDPATGLQRAMYAACPRDGRPASIWRVVRGPAHAITEAVMRCATCGDEFSAPPDSLYLR